MAAPLAPIAVRPAGVPRASGSLLLLPPLALLQSAETIGRDVRLVMREERLGRMLVVTYRGGQPMMVFSPADGRSLGELLLSAGAVKHAAMADLIAARTATPGVSLEALLLEHTQLSHDEIQRFLNFQARGRLLDALAWREGTFELEELGAGSSSGLPVEIPSLTALALRAAARARALPRLLEQLPAPPEHCLLRRRRVGSPSAPPLARAAWEALSEPLLVPQLQARLMADDDMLLETVLALAEARAVTIQPRVSLADAASGPSPHYCELIGEAARRRGADTGAIWVVVVSDTPDGASRLVRRLGGDPGPQPEVGATGLPHLFASRSLQVGRNLRLCLLAIRPGTLSSNALRGVMARCDVLCLAQLAGEAADAARLLRHHALLAPMCERPPLALAVRGSASLPGWADVAQACIAIPGWERHPSLWLLERLIEGIFAASSSLDT